MANPKPLITIIMPIRNEADFIRRSLGAVLQQDYPPACMEVLVADGMSDDHTRDVIAELQAQHPDVSVKVLDNPGKIVPTGFNIALKQAKGDVIIRVDGHTIVDPDYVQQCVNTLENADADNVGGRMNAVGSSELAEAIALATSSPFGVGGARFHYSDKQEYVDTVYMGAWRREVFDRIGFFDEELVRNQDDEFNYRLRAQGGKILLNPQINSVYYNRASLSKLWKQYYQYGFWKVRVMQKHPGQMRMRQFIPPLFVLSLGGAAFLSLFTVWGKRLLFLVAGAYSIANFAASFFTAKDENQKHLGRLPLIFTILHVSYGAGFLMGLLKFRDRWNGRESHHP